MQNWPSNTTTILSRWYQNITELPLNRFIDVAVNDNLHALTIAGDPSINDLGAAWTKINAQYADAMGNSEHKFFTTLYKEVTLLSTDYFQIQELVDVLLHACFINIYHEGLYSELNKLCQTSFQFSKTAMNDNIEMLKRCRNRSKGLKIQLDLKEHQLEAILKKNVTGKLTHEYFQSTLITLSDHARYPVHDSITVFEYCERFKRYNHYCEQLNSPKNARR